MKNQDWLNQIESINNSTRFTLIQIEFDDSLNLLDPMQFHVEFQYELTKLNYGQSTFEQFKTWFTKYYKLTNSDFDFWRFVILDKRKDMWIEEFHDETLLIKSRPEQRFNYNSSAITTLISRKE